MAKNWSAGEAAAVIIEGTNKAAIQDIGRRFPLFAVAAASGTKGLLEIIQATPEHMTTRKIESKFKEGLDETTLEDDVEEAEEEVEVAKEAAKGKAKGKGKKKPEPEVEEDDEDEEEEEAPKKPAKGKGKKKPVVEEEDEDEDEEDEDDDGYDDMSLVELKKAAKKAKVDIKGLKKPKEIIAALRADADDEEDEDEDDDEWDI